MTDRPTRIDLLAKRVSWLDRRRRVLAIVGAVILTLLLGWKLSGSLADGPTMFLGLTVGVILWWVVELGLVWLTALWETECAQLIRDRGLPRAVLRK